MKSVKVPLKKLNDVRKELMEKELMRMDYRIKAEADYGYIPIKEDIEGYEIVDIELKELNTHPHNFPELLEDEWKTKRISLPLTWVLPVVEQLLAAWPTGDWSRKKFPVFPTI